MMRPTFVSSKHCYTRHRANFAQQKLASKSEATLSNALRSAAPKTTSRSLTPTPSPRNSFADTRPVPTAPVASLSSALSLLVVIGRRRSGQTIQVVPSGISAFQNASEIIYPPLYRLRSWPHPPEEEPQRPLPRVTLIVRDLYKTAINKFGLWREYLHRPSYEPDSLISIEDLANPGLREAPTVTDPRIPPEQPTSFINKTISLLMAWFNNGNPQKSEAELNALVRDVLLHPDFDVTELEDFDAGRANKQADKDARAALPLLQDFKETMVEIEVPSGVAGVPPMKTCSWPLSSEPDLFHEVCKGAAEEIRVFSELYNSDAFIAEHDRIQRHGKLPPDDLCCTREKIIAALMFWSDSTHLANFGAAKLWPIYMLFGNLFKYIRCIPGAGAEHHVAFIPSLPDTIQDKISKFHAKWGTQKSEILTHCRRELMHAVWELLLDDEFLHAYTYGIVIMCRDGIERRVYPRIFTYSADYPEKVLLATIRDGGGCPCPRCLTPKSQLHLMGYVRDISVRLSNPRKYLSNFVELARHRIYTLGQGIGSKAVDDLLKESSSVPTVNAFIKRLGSDFDLHQMLVVDFMHEFELGVWKNIFTHLIRLLLALPDGVAKVAELDSRYRHIPTFGKAKIRRFATNSSEMKKMSPRDFENLLKCAIPVFNGLFPPEDNDKVLLLLYRLVEWHMFAKLRMQTEPTIDHLEKLTAELGRVTRDFKQKLHAEDESNAVLKLHPRP
ncbi:hypothetical protein B0H14DRAFT_3468789 [Mycena olivaceomarginata]|nr:hypothetical protein B0H14DRAFT_3468789 [Mycena olivaceomarginata]